MVQLASRSRHDVDNVYKLGFAPGRSVYSLDKILQYLDEAGYYHPKQPSWTRAFRLIVRCQSGLLSYEKYGVAELRDFAAARGIAGTGSAPQRSLEKRKKAELVQILEQADEEMTFRLMDLPPELRNHIYIDYLDTLPTMPKRFVQSPLCLASQELRHDTLKVFYARCAFTLVFHVEGHRFRGNTSETYGVSVDSTVFDSVSPVCISYMTSFEVQLLPRMRRSGCTPASLGTWRVAISDTEGEAQSTLPPREESNNGNRGMRDQIDDLDGDFVTSLGTWAKLVSQRPGPRKLEIGDIDTMRLALQEVVLDKRFPWLGFLPQRRRIKTRNGKHGTYDEDERSSYWKAGIGTCRDRLTANDYANYLDKHGFQYKNGLSKQRLFELTTRCQRGLPSYQNVSMSELLQSADSHGIVAPTAGTASKRRAGLEALLEAADDQRAFPRFTELPPELRMRVYQHYFASLDLPHLPGGPEIPPLFLVSRRVTAAGRGVFGFGSSAVRHWHHHAPKAYPKALTLVKHLRVSLHVYKKVWNLSGDFYQYIDPSATMTFEVDFTIPSQPVSPVDTGVQGLFVESEFEALVSDVHRRLDHLVSWMFKRSSTFEYRPHKDHVDFEKALSTSIKACPVSIKGKTV
ncbi:hypothetical protein LTR95_010448 [Oleoguttula sp. CCFEE 5521]